MPKKKSEKPECDESEGLMACLRRIAPKGEDATNWEISRTTDLVLSEVRYVLTTGIESFDGLAGGIPFGRILELYGLESCGKTAMVIRCAARAMKKHVCEVIRNEDRSISYRSLKPSECKVVVLYVDNEQSLDDDDKLLVDGEKVDVIGCRFDTTDDVFKAINQAISYQKERLVQQEKDGILRFMLVIVDTIASTSTKQELAQGWGTEDYPRQPQQISRALRRLLRQVNRYNVACLFTNQVRCKFQERSTSRQTFTIQADDYSSPGGMALKFAATHRIFMYSLQQKFKLVPDAQFPAGLLVGFFTKKNRIKQPLREGRMVLLFDKNHGGFNDIFSVLETLVFLKFVEVASKERHTGYTLLFKDNGIKPKTFEPNKLETTLEEDEITPAHRRGSSRKDPGFKTRSEWPQFYAEHKEDIMALWAKAMEFAMSTEGLDLDGGIQVVEEDQPAAIDI